MLFNDRNKCLSNNPNFSYDEACIDILNTLETSVRIVGQYLKCHQCSYQNLTVLEARQNTSVLVNTRYSVELAYVAGGIQKCGVTKLLEEHYRYGWNLTEACSSIYIKEPTTSAYLPILSAFIFFFFFGTFWYLVKCIYKNSGRLRRLFMSATNADLENDLGSSSGLAVAAGLSPLARSSSYTGGTAAPKICKHPNRIKSIDVFRGFCIIVMIFVNMGGGKYSFFLHAPWNGLTLADLVFPWFMWLMGISLSISLHNRLRRGTQTKRELFVSVIRRSLILIFMGVVLNSHKNAMAISELRFPGVLQRLGITYMIVGLLEVAFVKLNTDNTNVNTNASLLADLSEAWPQWNFMGIMIIIHTCITFLVEVPGGCGRGYLGPGGLDVGGRFSNCTGGAAGYLDRLVFGEHMYKTPACRKLYETTVYYDPEGLLGTLTATVTVYFGVQAGRILYTYQSVAQKMYRWIIWGVVLSLVGGGLCEFRENDGLIPINKQLWSVSYMCVMSGSAFLLQACLFLLVDIWRKWGGRPFFYPGMNALLLYIGHEIFAETFPFQWRPTVATHGAFLFMNLWGTALWTIIAICLYKNNYFFAL